MKKLLILAILGLLGLAWRSEGIVQMLQVGHQQSSSNTTQITVASLMPSGQSLPQQNLLSLEELAKLSVKDPQAYHAYLRSVSTERTEVDKLMNFLAHGRYE
ncbi:MAG: hypothetical protein JSR19_13655 [Proteobacteria bacterium]|nr:hypothetical protein [Pseudomonadota bacterium]HQR02744.1 hypothetical protein [Rhodocyclaceae bacterium]